MPRALSAECPYLLMCLGWAIGTYVAIMKEQNGYEKTACVR